MPFSATIKMGKEGKILLKSLFKIKNSIISAVTGIGLSIANIFAGRDFFEYAVSIIGDALSVVFDHDKEKQENKTE
ncbi:MAG: hypothetical protein IKU46_03020 [Peptococcaceae bacterium]|nr:hypothetical protein [Peptococcaceae bacterium]